MKLGIVDFEDAALDARISHQMPAGVVFDLDGTLVDSVADLATSLNLLLAQNGLPSLSLDAVRGMVGDGVRKLVARAWKAHGVPADEPLLDRLTESFLAIYAPRATEQTVLYPGAAKLITDLTRAGVRLGLCTNKPTAISRTILKKLDVLEPFGVVMGGDCGLPKKPQGDMMREALRLMGVAPEGAVMIGDSAADVGAARNAGIAIILVSYGYSATPAVSLNPDGVIASLGDALKMIQTLRGSS